MDVYGKEEEGGGVCVDGAEEPTVINVSNNVYYGREGMFRSWEIVYCKKNSRNKLD